MHSDGAHSDDALTAEGRALRELVRARLDSDARQRDVAELFKVDQSSISRWYREGLPSARRREAIKILGVSNDQLVGWR